MRDNHELYSYKDLQFRWPNITWAEFGQRLYWTRTILSKLQNQDFLRRVVIRDTHNSGYLSTFCLADRMRDDKPGVSELVTVTIAKNLITAPWDDAHPKVFLSGRTVLSIMTSAVVPKGHPKGDQLIKDFVLANYTEYIVTSTRRHRSETADRYLVSGVRNLTPWPDCSPLLVSHAKALADFHLELVFAAYGKNGPWFVTNPAI